LFAHLLDVVLHLLRTHDFRNSLAIPFFFSRDSCDALAGDVARHNPRGLWRRYGGVLFS
jgi:hypothetical protein